MEVISHNGITYTKAAILAREFGYTTDYLGQLCRGKKVDARLVGRAWYVNKESLIEHRKNRYAPTETASQPGPTPAEISKPIEEPTPATQVAVEPVLQKKTLKALAHAKSIKNSNYISYSPDEGPLVPAVKPTAEQVSQPIRITLAEAEKVPIKTEKGAPKATKYAPEPIPNVYMAGKVMVTELPDKSDIPVTAVAVPKKAATVRISGAFPRKQVVSTQPTQTTQSSTPKRPVSKKPEKREKPENLVNTSYIGKSIKPEMVGNKSSAAVPVTFAPRSVTTQVKKNTPKRIPQTSQETPKRGVAIAWLVILFAIVCSGALLTVELEVYTNGEYANTHVTLQTSLIASLLERW